MQIIQVQAEIKKTWHRYNLRNGNGNLTNGRSTGNGTWNTMTSYVTRARASLYSINSNPGGMDSTVGAVTTLDDIDVSQSKQATCQLLDPEDEKNGDVVHTDGLHGDILDEETEDKTPIICVTDSCDNGITVKDDESEV